MNNILELMAQKSGMYGFFANHGFGTTTLSMQLVDEINRRKRGIAVVLSLEISADQWKKRVEDLGFSTDRIHIIDKIDITVSDIQELLKTTPNISVICIDYVDLLNEKIENNLKEMSEKYGVPIIVNGKLSRDSGDYDPELRPELWSVSTIRKSEGNIKLFEYDFLALLHRKHKCDRGIGTADRYDIQNETELIIKRNRHGQLGVVFIKWDETQKRFVLC